MKPILQAQGLCKSFGGLKAVHNVEIALRPGEILSLIGPNGAGKTTLFNCLSGIYTPDSGQLFLNGKEITGLPSHEICRFGIARTFQNIRLFGKMTACENILAAQYQHRTRAPWGFLLRTPHYQVEEKDFLGRAQALLEFVGLGKEAHRPAESLSYGLQRRLEIARALATQPKVLLLDEPGAGMNPREIGDLLQLILRIRERGFAILFIEHHMKVVMEISDRICVLNHGQMIATGTPSEVRKHPQVVAAYLGTEQTH